MIHGETVKVLRPSIAGMDAYNTPIRKWSEESVGNVLVGSPTQDNVATRIARLHVALLPTLLSRNAPGLQGDRQGNRISSDWRSCRARWRIDTNFLEHAGQRLPR